MKSLTKSEAYVLEIIRQNPGCQNDEIRLLEAIYIAQGWDDTKSLYWNLSRVMHPESASRARRKLFEYGLIEYSEKAYKRRSKAFQTEQERHGSHYERMAEIVKPKYHLAVIDGEEMVVVT